MASATGAVIRSRPRLLRFRLNALPRVFLSLLAFTAALAALDLLLIVLNPRPILVYLPLTPTSSTIAHAFAESLSQELHTGQLYNGSMAL